MSEPRIVRVAVPPQRVVVRVAPPKTIVVHAGRGSKGLPGDPGPPGTGSGAIADANEYAAPAEVVGNIDGVEGGRVRQFITGTFDGPTIDDGEDTKELYLFYTGAESGTLKSKDNLQLFGDEYIMTEGSMVCLHWVAGAAKYIEDHRNGI